MLDVLLGLVVEGVKDLFHSEVGHNMMHAAVHNVCHAVNHASNSGQNKSVKKKSSVKKRRAEKGIAYSGRKTPNIKIAKSRVNAKKKGKNQMNGLLFKASFALCKALRKAGPQVMGREIADIVDKHSIGASAAALGSAWIPGAGGAVATVAAAGFVWSMYVRINSKIGVPFSKNILKSLATAISANLASSVVGSVVVASALSFIPGLGNIGASVIMAAVAFSLTWSCGLVYLKVLTRFAEANIDFDTVDEDDLKTVADEVLAEEDIKEMMKQAKDQFKKAKARGAIRKGAKEIALEGKTLQKRKSGSAVKRTASAKSKITTRSRRSKK